MAPLANGPSNVNRSDEAATAVVDQGVYSYMYVLSSREDIDRVSQNHTFNPKIVADHPSHQIQSHPHEPYERRSFKRPTSSPQPSSSP
jgi:hypothetical protein